MREHEPGGEDPSGRTEPSAPRDEGEEHLWFRRGVLARLGWGALLATLAASFVALVRLLYPRAPIEAPTHFPVGRPGEFVIGTVVGKQPPSGRGRRVWLVRTKAGFFALLGRCTHLGCSPRWRAEQSVFKCPCHGSVFDRGGHHKAGPAPRPLERVRIALDESGRIVVDPSRRFRHELGEWDDPDSFL